jgi:hypothetical protein
MERAPGVRAEGLGRTADWYYGTKQREPVMAMLDRRLTER